MRLSLHRKTCSVEHRRLDSPARSMTSRRGRASEQHRMTPTLGEECRNRCRSVHFRQRRSGKLDKHDEGRDHGLGGVAESPPRAWHVAASKPRSALDVGLRMVAAPNCRDERLRSGRRADAGGVDAVAPAGRVYSPAVELAAQLAELISGLRGIISSPPPSDTKN